MPGDEWESERMTLRWPAMIFFAPLWLANSSWAASCWAMAFIVGVGWLRTAQRGTLGRVPGPCALLAGWALGRSLVRLWGLSLTSGTTMVALGSSMLPYQVIPIMFQLGGVLLALATIQWAMSWTNDQSNTVMTMLCWTMTALVALGVLQLLNLDQFNIYDRGRSPDVVGGTLGNPTLFAGLLAIGFPLWLTWRHRAALWIAAVAAGLILRSGSVTAVVAMLIVVWWISFLQPTRRGLAWMAVVLLLAAAVFGAFKLHAGGYL